MLTPLGRSCGFAAPTATAAHCSALGLVGISYVSVALESSTPATISVGRGAVISQPCPSNCISWISGILRQHSTALRCRTSDRMAFQQVLGLGWPTLAAASLGAYIVGGSTYRLYFSPLANFPGPKLAALTLWYEFYYDVVKSGSYMFEIEKMHKQYGTDHS